MKIRQAKREQGLILVFTGNGKGKTTAAVGSAVRMIKHGKRVAMVQFFKAPSRHMLPHTQFKVWSFGGGFTWQTSRKENLKAARDAWKKCVQLLRDPRYALVILDEINIALKYKFLNIPGVIRTLRRRPKTKHVILTGRGAPKALLKAADLVTEMRCVKHPFDRGVPAQPGVEF
ncbi:MAG TPA: cob(I)yrinic acid a,c-diamide adenosyltransferase [Candidatus Omnitrophota bacterium]|nr:cob(I)yrinic acid a,c-diamide adenosyltransferase [Candidatus Omnitrophota bacterium]HRY85118.1 cob(I)yrinic acid a,c-diamide adenosyltransferase [Candidatus Omnitrophota bacterium]